MAFFSSKSSPNCISTSPFLSKIRFCVIYSGLVPCKEARTSKRPRILPTSSSGLVSLPPTFFTTSSKVCWAVHEIHTCDSHTSSSRFTSDWSCSNKSRCSPMNWLTSSTKKRMRKLRLFLRSMYSFISAANASTETLMSLFLMRSRITSMARSESTSFAICNAKSNRPAAKREILRSQSYPLALTYSLNSPNFPSSSSAFSKYCAIGRLKELYPRFALNWFQKMVVKVLVRSTLASCTSPMLNITISTSALFTYQFLRALNSERDTPAFSSSVASFSLSNISWVASINRAKAFSLYLSDKQ